MKSDVTSQSVPSFNAEQPLEIDRLIHQPSRFAILAILLQAGEADFRLLETVTKLQKSNLSMQTAKLERAGYIAIHKYIKGKFAATRYSMTPLGRTAFARYLNTIHALQQAVEQHLAEQAQENEWRGAAAYLPTEQNHEQTANDTD